MKPCFTGVNLTASAVISVSSQAPNMPATNLATPHRWQKFRTLGTTEWIALDHATAKPQQIFWAVGVNWSPAAQLQVRLSNTSAEAGDLYNTRQGSTGYLTTEDGAIITSESGRRLVLGDGGFTFPVGNVDPVVRQWLLVLDTAIAARYTRFDILDGSNAAGFLDTGILHVGALYQMGRYEDYGAQAHMIDLSGITETPAGASFIDPRGSRRARDFTVANIDEDEYFAQLLPVLAQGPATNLGFVPRPQHERQNQEAIYGLLQADKPVINPTNRRVSFSGQIRERL